MKYLLSFIAALTLASLACGFSFDIPSVPTAGPAMTDEISVAVRESDETRLTISFGAGELTLSPGAENVLVEGTATYSIPSLKPEINVQNSTVELKQGDFKSLNVTDFKNEWN